MSIISPQQIRRKRRALGWSVNELAHQTGLSFATVARAEKTIAPKRSGTHRETLQKIKEALDRGPRRTRPGDLSPGQKLKKRRQALGLSRNQLGQRAEPPVSAGLIENIEMWGRSAPAEMARLSAVLEKAEADRPAAVRFLSRRVLLGWSQPTLAQKSGVSIITIWKLENGLTKANLPILEALDAALRAGETSPQRDVGAELRARRVATGLRVADLSKLAKINPTTISAIENERVRPKAQTLQSLNAALDVQCENHRRQGVAPAEAEVGAAGTLTPADVRQRRIALRLTAKELAHETDINASTLRLLESGKSCEAPIWRKLIKAFARLGAGTPLPTGEEIRRQRESLGLSLDDLARRAGISVQALWCFEKGRRRATTLTVRAIEAALREARADGQTTVPSGRRTSRLRPKASRSAKARWASAKTSLVEQSPSEAAAVAEKPQQGKPWVPTAFQRRILEALKGKALTGTNLEDRLNVDRKRLYRDGLNPLKARGLVISDRSGVGGYYRPDAPPSKVAEFLAGN